MVAKRFLKKTLASYHATKPRSITADGDKAYPVAIRELKKEKCIPHSTPLRVKKYCNYSAGKRKKACQIHVFHSKT